MRITLIIMLSFIYSMFGRATNATDDYDQMWKAVQTAMNAAQPRTAKERLLAIEKKAVKEHHFSQTLAARIGLLKCQTDVEPDSFAIMVDELERQYADVKNAADRAVAHAMFVSMYNEQVGSWSARYDNDRQAEMRKKRDEHCSHLFDDMEALADAKAEAYKPLTELKKDGAVYGHDMLAVMVDFVPSGGWSVDSGLMLNVDDIRRKAAAVYAKRGQKEAEAMMLLPTLTTKEDVHKLLLAMKDSDVGMDIAAKYMELIGREGEQGIEHRVMSEEDDEYDAEAKSVARNDETLRFIRWAKENVKMSGAWATLEAREKQIMCPSAVVFSDKDCLLAGVECPITIKYNNVERVQIEVHKFNGYSQTSNRGRELRTDGPVVLRRTVQTGCDEANMARKREHLPALGKDTTSVSLPAGHYVVVCTIPESGNKRIAELKVTSMQVISQRYSADKTAVYVVDAIDGRPLKGIKVSGRGRTDSVIEQHATDERGMAMFTNDILRVQAERSAGDKTDWIYVDSYYSYNRQDEHIKCNIFCDRAIYRPGHTVKGNVLVYNQNGDEVAVSPGVALMCSIASLSGNWKKETELKTNALGTADFEIELPDDAEVGMYWLHIRQAGENTSQLAYQGIRVEEYKRPTFEVTLHHQSDFLSSTAARAFALGDSITVEGKAMSFADVPVQGAEVKVEIERAHGSMWRWRPYDWRHIDTLELTTDSEGRFIVPVHLFDTSFSADRYSHCVFRVKAAVTDQSGETREGEWTVRVGKWEYELATKMPINDNILDLDDDPCFTVMARNANGADVNAEGEYRLVMGTDTIASGTFKTGEKIALDRELPFGHCELLLKSVDGKGNVIKLTTRFTMIHKQAKACKFDELSAERGKRNVKSANSEDFIYAPSTDVSEQQPADIFFAPDTDDSYIYYSVFAGNQLVESKQAVLGNDQHRITVPFKKEYGDGFTVSMFYVRNGRVGRMEQSFTYVKPDKRLTLSWSTFRDKLQPGAREEWVLNVKDKQGRAVSGAELMAVMYDAALDRITPHDWRFNLAFVRTLSNVNFRQSYLAGFGHFAVSASLKPKHFNREFDYLKLYEHNMYARSSARAMYAAGMPMLSAKARTENVTGAQDSADMLEGAIAGLGTLDDFEEKKVLNEVMLAEEAVSDDFSNATVRSNFAETAFFMPHLASDYAGNVRIAFTLPESLTEWQFRALAHTASMDYGTIDTTAVARKLFMVRPNMPRFVRHGDKASIASAIINQSDAALSGTVRMRLINPETDEEVLVMKEAFRVEAGQTTNVAFSFPVLETYEGMDCEIIAVSGDTSDGEKNHLPVLSAKQEMVETVPFYLIGDEEKTVDLSALFNDNSKTATNRKLAIDYTASPAWMCIDALRSMSVPDDDDAISLAAAFHANSRLLALYENSMLPVSCDSLNPSCKELQALLASARDRLLALQKADGGWSWCKGMESNYHVTLSVCEQLALPIAPSREAMSMLSKGLKWLDNWELKQYNERKRLKDKDMTPSASTLRYLYVCSLQAQMCSKNSDIVAMRKAYLSTLEKHINDLTIYGIANSSCALRAFGSEKVADKFVESLRQHLVTKPGQGSFYATDAAYYSWMDYRIPTHTAAMRAMELQYSANRFVAWQKDPHLKDMALWLITQKQVQRWDNPLTTIEAVEILMRGWLQCPKEGVTPAITIDGKPVTDFRVATLNTERDKLEGRMASLDKMGNVVADIDASLIEKGIKSMTIKAPLTSPERGDDKNHSAFDSNTPPVRGETAGGLSWGFAQATFVEDMNRVKRYATNELSVDRKLYVLRNGEWEEMPSSKTGRNGAVQLAVGDRVRIRHTVKADRDMDFVRLTAQHPACFEPVKALSGYLWLGTRYGYVGMHDSHATVSFDWFTRGSTTIDTEYYVTRAGEYQVGISTVECAYAKQFGGHTSSCAVTVK